jgi:hypothetical protein
MAVKSIAPHGVKAPNGKRAGKKGASRGISQVFFRAPSDLIERVERLAKGRTIVASRQTWLLEAIVEKLEREEGSNGSK